MAKKEIQAVRQEVRDEESGMLFPQLDDLAVEEQEVAAGVEDTKKTAVRMAFIGAGQGGCKLADEFWRQGYRRVLLVNTTDQDMAGLECPNRVILGGASGGAGKNPDVGRRAADAGREDVLRACKKMFGSGVELVMVCTGAGGGTGTGATPILVDVAGEYLEKSGSERRVGVISSFPKASEGPTVVANAQALMGKLLDMVEEKKISPLVVMDNDKIGKLFPKTTITNFYKVANQNIVGLFNVFNELSAQSSPYSNLDPSDYRSILNSGALVFGMTMINNADDETAMAAAIERNVKGGLFSDSFSLNGATHAGAILVAAKEKLETIQQGNLDMAFETIHRVVGGNGLILHTGIYHGPSQLKDNVVLYTILGGMK